MKMDFHDRQSLGLHLPCKGHEVSCNSVISNARLVINVLESGKLEVVYGSRSNNVYLFY